MVPILQVIGSEHSEEIVSSGAGGEFAETDKPVLSMNSRSEINNMGSVSLILESLRILG
ncbi:MAG: hypothetical protein RI575_08680 [Balneolaceae bacterium]|nr:hypothetical protein [Balneolaceae bacterium]MDR9407615.1 hypothetical protein [Balneolaceae bacterium]